MTTRELARKHAREIYDPSISGVTNRARSPSADLPNERRRKEIPTVPETVSQSLV
jgi:hypothetical protein